MKKTIILMVMVFVLMISVVSCAKEENVLVASNDAEESTEETEEKAEEKTEEATSEEMETEDETEQEQEQEQEMEVILSETVLVDENDILIKAMSFGEGDFFGPSIDIYIENNSEEDIRVNIENVSVNDFMMTNFFMAEVGAGKKANEELSFSNDTLELCNIKYISNIDFEVEIREPDTYDMIYDPIPVQIKTSIYGGYEQKLPEGGEVLMEQDGIKITYLGSSMDGFFGPEMYYFIENNSDEGATINARDVSVNGFMIDPYFSCTIVQGKYAVEVMSFSKSEFEDNNIEEFDAVEFYFHVYEAYGWDALFDSEVINIGESNADGADSSEVSGELLVDQDGIKISYLGFDDDESFGVGFRLLIENTTEDTITVQSHEESINGFMVDGIMSVDVAPNKKANDTISIWDSELEKNNITDVGVFEFKIKVLNADNWDDIFETGTLNIVNKEGVPEAPVPEGDLLVDEGGIKIIYVDREHDKYSGEQLRFYIENNTEEGFTVNTANVSVNGFMISAPLYDDVMPGKRIYSVITVRDDDLEENNIEKIEELELTFEINQYVGWGTIYTSEPIVIDDFS